MTACTPADLMALIDYTGLSIQEAATVIGIGHEAVGRKLAGKERYPVRPSDIEPLRSLADRLDLAVAETVALIDRRRRDGETVVVAAPQYRHADDLPDGQDMPLGAHRMMLARIQRARPDNFRPVAYDRAGYDLWRGPGPDTPEKRDFWAAAQVPIVWGDD